MISEKQFISHYDSFWKDKLPFQNIFQRKINLEAENMEIGYLKSSIIGRRRSYLSQVAFMVYKFSVEKDIDLLKRKLSAKQQENIEKICHEQFKHYALEIHNINICLSNIEWNEVYELAKRLFIFYNKICLNQNVIFSPQFCGCGVVNQCYGDIFVGNCLYEIKMVDRNFRLSDIRQLLIYCVLNNIQGNKYDITEVCLLNPRSGKYFKKSINDFSIMLSGKEYLELSNDICDFITQEIIEE